MKSYFFTTLHKNIDNEYVIKKSRAFDAKDENEAWKIAQIMRKSGNHDNHLKTTLYCIDSILKQKCSENYVKSLLEKEND